MEEKNCQRSKKEGKVDHRLKKNSQFNYIYRKGQRVSSKHFVLFIVKSRFDAYKIGYAITKKVGKANIRNLLRRRLKEIVRINNLAQKGKNYILHARDNASEVEFNILQEEIIKLFEKGKRLDNLG